MRTLLLASALLLTACAPSNLADVVKAQGASVRSSYARITTIYGSAVICGSGAVNVTVTCNADGMSIRQKE